VERSLAMLSVKWIVNEYVVFYNRMIAEQLAGKNEVEVGSIENISQTVGKETNTPRGSQYFVAKVRLDDYWYDFVFETGPLNNFKALVVNTRALSVTHFWEMMHVLYTHSPPYHHPQFQTDQNLFAFLKKNPSYMHEMSKELFFCRR
jgi:hypothetical protein